MLLNKSIYWFEKKDDGQELVNAAGQRYFFNEINEEFNNNKQLLASWQRAMLYIQYNGIWDITAFSCGMDTPVGVGPIMKTKSQKPFVYVFCTPQLAEKNIYPSLNEKDVEKLRNNVDDFYNDSGLQIVWNQFILRPVCIKVTKDGNVSPVSVRNLKPEEIILRRRFTVFELDPKQMYNDFNFVDDYSLNLDEAKILDTVSMEKVEKAISLINGIDEIPWKGGEPSGKKTKDGEDVFIMPFPIYPDGVFESLSFLGWDKNYRDNYEKSCKGVDIDDMNVYQLQTMFTRMQRGERFCDGFISGEIKNGNLLNCLERLRTLVLFYTRCINAQG